jgi:hypothetical protein
MKFRRVLEKKTFLATRHYSKKKTETQNALKRRHDAAIVGLVLRQGTRGCGAHLTHRAGQHFDAFRDV